jgi:integrase
VPRRGTLHARSGKPPDLQKSLNGAALSCVKPLHTIATLLLGAGLRRGECLALRWQDFDLDGGTLRVEQAQGETPRGGRQFKPPKAAAS